MENFRCPFCGKDTGTALNAHLYGSPFRTCPNCRNTYVDNRYHEIAVEGVRAEDMKPNKQEKGKNRKSGMISILAGIGSLILCVIIVAATGWLFYVLPIFGVISIIGGFANLKGYTKEDLKKREQALEMERQQSIRRMQNPQYVEQLRSIGYLAPAAPMYSSQSVQQPVYQQQYACRNCGAPLDAGDRFCSRCGATN